MDFFTVPTLTFGMLYCFFVISNDRRRILHYNVTRHPTSLWIVQQLREAFPFDSAPRFLIFDRDAKYGLEVPAAVRSLKRMQFPQSSKYKIAFLLFVAAFLLHLTHASVIISNLQGGFTQGNTGGMPLGCTGSLFNATGFVTLFSNLTCL